MGRWSVALLALLAGCSSGPSLEESRLLPRYGLKVTPGRTTQPTTAPAFLNAARVTTDAGWDELHRGRLDEAMQDFNAAWRIDPSNAGTLWGMAVVEMRRAEKAGPAPTPRGLGLLDQACQLYDDATHQTPSAALRVEAAGAHTLRGQYRVALQTDGASDDYAAADRLLTDAERRGDPAAVYGARAALERARGNAGAADAYARRAATMPSTVPATGPSTERPGGRS